MNLKLTPGRLLAAAIVVLSVWIVHDFIEALLAACMTAIASWPLYAAFRSRLPSRVGNSASAAIFTGAITLLVLAPMLFACWALLSEAHALLLGLAAADSRGLGVPDWLANAPVMGPWLAARWQSQLPGPGALLMLTQRTDPSALLGWTQALGQFTARHALIVGFAILLLAFLYREGASLQLALGRWLREAVGDHAERYVDIATRAVRASVSSMLVVALFDGLAIALAYTIAGAPRALLWAAITGSLAAVPFLGYGAVAAMAIQIALEGGPTTAMISLLLGCAVLITGDKAVRPMVAGGGMQLPFVWVLMGCIGGLGVLGLTGVVIGPVVLTLAWELWDERVRQVGPALR
ncbi:AI-2E family transporter [Variovorax ginsengisoli]|uniref:AI-2E family transporter n=1 Tax=Variovorax ginsengisoli TaxID=363844 RepID=A0ABT8S1X9_9BURK|nr:AI-2E family transporter [Variovorax ginsengisoli]MDN8613653.1 AI-2E family transporter [Variovorax ginsengisoli]MDO1532823.1 AI-2E family transporter [Variovorax ginsengisoli]